MMILLCGMIASGKTTLCDRLAKRGDVIVNDDSFVLALHNNNYDLYRKEYKGIYKSTETAAILACLQTHKNVVIDRPNFKKSTRHRYAALAAAFDVPVVCVVFPKEDALTHAERRFKSDSRGLSLEHWIEAASRHAAEWEDPQMEEGFDNIIPSDVAIQMIEEGKL